MRIITTQTEAYKFDELSEDVQNKVIKHWRDNMDYPWIYDNKASLEQFQKSFDFVDIEDFQYGYHSYINYTITNGMEDLAGVRLWKWLMNNDHNTVYSWQGSSTKPKIVSIFDSCPLTGYYIDDDLLQPLRDFLKRPGKSITLYTLYTLMGDCLNAWLDACNKEYEYCHSEKAIREDIKTNDYEFTKEGKLI